MATERRKLSQKAVTVLTLIAHGHSYEQLLALEPGLTYLDIFDAAREALALAEDSGHDYHERMADIRTKHSRAYEPWSSEEDIRLAQLVQAGESTRTISDALHRQPGAVRSRIAKLNITIDEHD